MRKSDEASDHRSCWNKARDDERVFVILERDKSAPATIRFWAAERIRLGLNKEHGDPQIVEALESAWLIEETQKGRDPNPVTRS